MKTFNVTSDCSDVANYSSEVLKIRSNINIDAEGNKKG